MMRKPICLLTLLLVLPCLGCNRKPDAWKGYSGAEKQALSAKAKSAYQHWVRYFLEEPNKTLPSDLTVDFITVDEFYPTLPRIKLSSMQDKIRLFLDENGELDEYCDDGDNYRSRNAYDKPAKSFYKYDANYLTAKADRFVESSIPGRKFKRVYAWMGTNAYLSDRVTKVSHEVGRPKMMIFYREEIDGFQSADRLVCIYIMPDTGKFTDVSIGTPRLPPFQEPKLTEVNALKIAEKQAQIKCYSPSVTIRGRDESKDKIIKDIKFSAHPICAKRVIASPVLRKANMHYCEGVTRWKKVIPYYRCYISVTEENKEAGYKYETIYIANIDGYTGKIESDRVRQAPRTSKEQFAKDDWNYGVHE